MRSLDRVERYGLVSLVFLVTTIVAVTLWDAEPKKKEMGSDPGAARAAAPGDDLGTSPATASAGRPDPSRRSTPPGGPALARSRPGDPGWTSPATTPGEANAGSPGTLTAAPGAVRRAAGTTVLNGDALAGLPQAGSVQFAPSADEVALRERRRAELKKAKREKEPRTTASAFVSPVPGATRTVAVAQGETLSEIAERELGSSRRYLEIMTLNGIDDATRVHAGTVLRLPPGSGAARVAAPSRAPEEPGGPTCLVRENDSYWRIAERVLGAGHRWERIAELNPDVPPEALRAGMTLVVPAGAVAPSAAKPVVLAAAGPASPSKRGEVR